MLSPGQLPGWKQEKSARFGNPYTNIGNEKIRPLPDKTQSCIWWQLGSRASLNLPFSRLGLSVPGNVCVCFLCSHRAIPSCLPRFSFQRFFPSTFYYQHFQALNKFKDLYNELPYIHFLDSITNIFLYLFYHIFLYLSLHLVICFILMMKFSCRY